MEYLYQKIAGSLQHRISAGDYEEGGQLPSVRALAAEFNTTAITVGKALDQLAASGYIERRPKVGMFVRPRALWGAPVASGLAGVIAFDTSVSVFWGRAVDAMVDAFGERGLHLVLGHSDHQTDRALEYVHLLVAKGIDGFIYVPMEADSPSQYLEINEPVLKAIRGSGVPVVLFDRTVPGWNLPSVTLENYNAGRAAATFLLDHGAAMPLCVSVQYCDTVADRERGFCDVLAARGVSDAHSRVLRFNRPVTRASNQENRAMLEHLIRNAIVEETLADGFFGVNSNVVNSLTAVTSRLGHRQRVPIAGMRELTLDDPDRVGLIIEQPIYEYGFEAGRLLADLIEARRTGTDATRSVTPHVSVDFEFTTQ